MLHKLARIEPFLLPESNFPSVVFSEWHSCEGGLLVEEALELFQV